MNGPHAHSVRGHLGPFIAQRAPLLRRYAALGYEGLLLAAVVLVVGFLTLPATRAGSPGGVLALPPLSGRVLSACLVFGAAGLYFTWSWTAGRRTLPMKTWRLMLIRADGRNVDGRTAVIRYFGAWIGPVAALAAHAALQPSSLGAHAAWLAALGYLWPIVDPDRQFLHDRIAGTRIVMAPPDPVSAAPAPRPR
ncbi:MAG: RDD family protein [Casimicrobiaceae bacterium]